MCVNEASLSNEPPHSVALAPKESNETDRVRESEIELACFGQQEERSDLLICAREAVERDRRGQRISGPQYFEQSTLCLNAVHRCRTPELSCDSQLRLKSSYLDRPILGFCHSSPHVLRALAQTNLPDYSLGGCEETRSEPV
eukprot:CAMPEP_0185781060 /NCGR_PEP_ID=MMETSP1174-20130828/101115_1 /TAXON_ID=35687 /ORGANISM="Dictyocha speculum, Strain CCMP1381" /LENGTH=141 /DNA_ID=CAMNT_0028470883 /DNA_START=103 /DNA_END=528 /DNA_ORIENTATION=+